MGELDRVLRVYRARAARDASRRYAADDPANRLRLEALEREAFALVEEATGRLAADLRWLDLGCGGGWWLRTLAARGVPPQRRHGCDLRAELASAGGAAVVRAAIDRLPYRGDSFDVVSQFTVFSSVLDPAVRGAAARQALRVLRPGGVVLWYDFLWNPLNRDTRGLGARDVRDLFPGAATVVRRVTLAPPLARPLARCASRLHALAYRLPWLRSHLLCVIVPRGES